ncbi:cationic peptide transport system substrate-binding protein [Pseudidiomarina maritima]|jgi:cationic peptide transport system substrate-binding protein|uniref:Cationic peptide transport system substrate-binding protein n=1 Tax=Pseudidiomarina maritima TaxID=519453 RepID=A0A1I6GF85_9GAMM|nr:ABC transporter substrate-binding protein [Pseudidiomarina maritima]SFR40864.1 cationic peptide transport system substrate-binding protein [Pseudidiomarina maritima]
MLKQLMIASSTLVLAACGPVQTDSEVYQDGLVYCSEGNPEIFNPQLVTSGTTVDATSAQLYDRLLDYDAKQQQFVPALARGWQAFEQGQRYRFNLRENVQFHTTEWFTPTRTFNADDVLFSFQRWLNEQHPYHQINGGRYPFFRSSGLIKLIEKVEKVDDYTVDFHLTQSDSSFLANLATDFAVVLSQEYAEQLLETGKPEQIDRLPIGTGPFEFELFRKDFVIRYSAHEGYWREQPEIKTLVYVITPNANKRMLKLVTGECDVIPYPLVDELSQLDQGAEIQVGSSVSPNVSFWAFNTQHPPFDNVLVRRALALAINRPAIIQTIYNGNARLATGMLPETSWAYSPVQQTYPYNPGKARELLAEAGYPNGFSMDIWAMPVQRAYNPNAQRMAELIQSDLAQVGVQANIVSYEWNTFRQRLVAGQHDSVLIGWVADNADPDNFFRPTLSCAAARSGNNRAQWCNPLFDQLLIDAITESDLDQRKHLYQAIEDFVMQQAPLVPIANSLRFQAHRGDIEGVELPPYGGINFRYARRVSDAPL